LSAVKKPARKTPKEQVTLEFPDNKILASLSGAHHKNFAALERRLGVRLAMRGNLIAIEGAARHVRPRSPAQAHYRELILSRPAQEARERLGFLPGDPSQSDLPGGRAEALAILEGVDGVGITRFGEQDVVRHALVTRIVGAYNANDAKRAAAKHS